MTDEQLERRLRAWYRAEVPVDLVAPTDLRSTLATIPQASTASVRRFASRRGITLLAAAALFSVAAGTALVGGLLQTRPAPPVHAAVWTATGGLINVHVNHTATLLPDGKVLVAGAYRGDGAPTSAELYDPSTGSWTATGDTIIGHVEHTATLLLDGRVLLAGGGDSGNARIAVAELFDPSSGSWTATGTMTAARSGHTATLLSDGRVLVNGGADGAPASAELYNPRSGAWTATGNMVEEHTNHTATLLPDGTVLVAGGEGSAELYDPRNGTWTATTAMIHDRWDATATLLADGTVLVVGDGEGGTSAELYDPRSGTWTATNPMVHGRFARLTATRLPDGTVLVAGGSTGDLAPGAQDFVQHELVFAELYDPRSGTWTATANLNVARRSHTATLLLNDTVLVTGGIGGNGAAYRSAELYEPGSGN